MCVKYVDESENAKMRVFMSPGWSVCCEQYEKGEQRKPTKTNHMPHPAEEEKKSE